MIGDLTRLRYKVTLFTLMPRQADLSSDVAMIPPCSDNIRNNVFFGLCQDIV